MDDRVLEKPEDKNKISEKFIEPLIEHMNDGYTDLGQPARRKQLLERLLRTDHFGKNLDFAAGTLNNLGNAYGEMGDYQK